MKMLFSLLSKLIKKPLLFLYLTIGIINWAYSQNPTFGYWFSIIYFAILCNWLAEAHWFAYPFEEKSNLQLILMSFLTLIGGICLIILFWAGVDWIISGKDWGLSILSSSTSSHPEVLTRTAIRSKGLSLVIFLTIGLWPLYLMLACGVNLILNLSLYVECVRLIYTRGRLYNGYK